MSETIAKLKSSIYLSEPKTNLTVEMEKSFQDMQAMLQGLQDSLDFPT